MLDFGALPPEINSTRMYTGPGSGSMITAAASWEGLAADLRSQAASYSSVVSGLTSDGWRGPASASMAAAAAPYAAWMNTTAAQTEQAANQAKAAAAGYEAAFSATVPPPVIAANRAQLASLVATNFLGQNTPAIAATEAHYAEMWAQDAVAMYGYAGSSAAATQLTPLTGPTQNTNAGALAGQSTAVAQATATSAGTGSQSLSQLVTTVPNTLQGLASPALSTSSSVTSSTSGLGGIWNLLTGGPPGIPRWIASGASGGPTQTSGTPYLLRGSTCRATPWVPSRACSAAKQLVRPETPQERLRATGSVPPPVGLPARWEAWAG